MTLLSKRPAIIAKNKIKNIKLQAENASELGGHIFEPMFQILTNQYGAETLKQNFALFANDTKVKQVKFLHTIKITGISKHNTKTTITNHINQKPISKMFDISNNYFGIFSK
ncbi:hypothetical protein SU69_02080 [Thermosipho melanesiensis]|uniref:Uncharacterized protein n=2 Tax=Thermosipho melanesiensis TaxID=46541 RepID=A6LK17_THEM4|nr:hypothetical protein [Thermosipho melanesiensis]ABR30268.1 hypothetical protein Tmel_0399 [Thermosipho melanesiensis BI429]APT74813.1 hypothetical protein BW47_02170 [Thermosipho melanesiensis]OOC37394.1 hypothetical protein SU68_02090 [Thermosipho melanesiensis]OOC39756.1 hypothetical protein SU69_02080 [Thermosipho melanesiensis]OOC39861.1 hypothetical protein SU70_02075 [Thermosipho melanesiensis]